jgi:hypothetical protein
VRVKRPLPPGSYLQDEGESFDDAESAVTEDVGPAVPESESERIRESSRAERPERTCPIKRDYVDAQLRGWSGLSRLVTDRLRECARQTTTDQGDESESAVSGPSTSTPDDLSSQSWDPDDEN